jgi:hypothetical protein
MKKVMSLRRQRWARVLLYGNGFEPFLPAYLVARHFTAHEILMLLALRQFLSFPLSVPTGLFADRYSRTLSLAIGSGACGLSIAAYGLASTWAGILCASVAGSIGKNFFCGADGALARHTHQVFYRIDWRAHYHQYAATFVRYQGLGEAACCLVATALAINFGLMAILLAQGLAYAVVFGLVATLREPPPVDENTKLLSGLSVDPATVAASTLLHALDPGAAMALSLVAVDADYVPDREHAHRLESSGLASVEPDGRLTLNHALFEMSHEIRTKPPNERSLGRGKPCYVLQLPPSAFAPVILKVVEQERNGYTSLRILEPQEFAAKWPNISRAPLIGGPMIEVQGPARRLTAAEYDQQLVAFGKRQQQMSRRSLLALLIAMGALASLTAVTYRLGPLYYGFIRYHGRPLPPAGYGWVWSCYLASVWVCGLSYRWIGQLTLHRSLAVLVALALGGGACYVVFGLVGSIWGLSAMVGLAFIRALETALATKFLNRLSSGRWQAGTLSVMRTMQDSMAACTLLVASWLTAAYSFPVALVTVGVIHAVVAGVALGVLAYLYKP